MVGSRSIGLLIVKTKPNLDFSLLEVTLRCREDNPIKLDVFRCIPAILSVSGSPSNLIGIQRGEIPRICRWESNLRYKSNFNLIE